MSSIATAGPEALELLGHVHVLLSKASPNVDDVVAIIEGARPAALIILTEDVDTPLSSKIESWTWQAHNKVANLFRAQIRTLAQSGQAKSVEARKVRTAFHRFLRRSLGFYRSHVHGLSLAHGAIAELVALGVKDRTDGAVNLLDTEKPKPKSARETKILASAYRSAIRVGDIWRYETTELPENRFSKKEPYVFYDLARCLDPTEGVAYNQMAIISLADHRLFHATYCFFKALTVRNGHAGAEPNLLRSFGKAHHQWYSGELFKHESDLAASYLRLISKCYRGETFVEYDEMVGEISTLLRNELDSNSSDFTAQDIFSMNFAAVYILKGKIDSPNAVGNATAYIYCLRNTLACICELLAFADTAYADVCLDRQGGDKPIEDSEYYFKKTMPLLRLSLLWASKNMEVLVNSVSAEVDALQATMWQHLAGFMTKSFSTFDIDSLPMTCGYLQEEDEIHGFSALDEANDTCRLPRRWNVSRIIELGGDAECRVRLRIIMAKGCEFALDKATPFDYDRVHKNFLYVKSQEPAAPQDTDESSDKSTEKVSHNDTGKASVSDMETIRGSVNQQTCGSILEDIRVSDAQEVQKVLPQQPGDGLAQGSGDSVADMLVSNDCIMDPTLSQSSVATKPHVTEQVGGAAGKLQLDTHAVRSDDTIPVQLPVTGPMLSGLRTAGLCGTLPRPGNGSHVENAFNAASPGTPSILSASSSTSSWPFSGSDSSQASTSGGNFPSTTGFTDALKGLGNGLFMDPVWGTSPIVGQGSSLLFTSGHHNFNTSSAETGRMQLESARHSIEHSLIV